MEEHGVGGRWAGVGGVVEMRKERKLPFSSLCSICVALACNGNSMRQCRGKSNYDMWVTS